MVTIDLNEELVTQWVRSLSRITALHFVLCRDRRYQSVPKGESPLCLLLQQQSTGRALCEEECTIPLSRATEIGSPVYFQCYAHLNNVAIPLQGENNGEYIMLGGRLIKSYDDLVGYRVVAEKLGCREKEILSIVKSVSLRDLEEFKSSIEAFKLTHRGVYSDSERCRIRILEESLARLNAITRVASTIGDIKDDREFYNTILDTIGVLFNVRTALFLLREEDSFVVREAFGYELDSLQRLKFSTNKGLIGEAAKRDNVVVSSNLADILKSGFPHGVYSVIVFPVSVRHKVKGLIVVINTSLSREDKSLIKAFSKSISLSLENRILSTRRDIFAKRELSIMQAIHSITDHIDSPELFKIIIEEAAEVIEAEKGSLMLFNEEEGYLRVKATKGLNPVIMEHVRINVGEGIAGHVLKTGIPLVVRDIKKDRRFGRSNRVRYRTGSFMSLPLRIKNRSIGVLNFSDKKNGNAFSTRDLSFIETVTLYSSVAIERRIYYQSSINFRRISITDPLTGLLNRRYFEERIAEEMERSRRHLEPFSLIIIDIDNFKDFNDTYGHLAGDEALKNTGHTIRKSVRIIDIAARYGGEEFAIILPTTGKEEAVIIGNRVREEMEKMVFVVKDRSVMANLTVSVGIATFPEDATGLEDLINNADKALYRAKKMGKNRVEVYSSE